MLERVVVVKERLLGVERRVEVGELDLAEVALGVRRDLGEAREGVQRIAPDEEILGGRIADRSRLVEESDLGDPVVGRRQPVPGPVLAGKQAPVLVRPGQL